MRRRRRGGRGKEVGGDYGGVRREEEGRKGRWEEEGREGRSRKLEAGGI